MKLLLITYEGDTEGDGGNEEPHDDNLWKTSGELLCAIERLLLLLLSWTRGRIWTDGNEAIYNILFCPRAIMRST
jgi:hypothetical protein